MNAGSFSETPSGAQEPTSVGWSPWIRRFHRWTSAAFTLSVIATSIALAQEKPVVWMSYVPLAPLAVLFLTGLYLFVLPYATKRRSRRSARQPIGGVPG